MNKTKRKILIRYSIASIAVIFAGMVVMSVIYVHKTTEVLTKRYDEEVMRALSATAKSVEEQDIIHQIEEIAKDTTELSAYAATFLDKVDTASDPSMEIYGRTIGKPTGIYGLTKVQMQRAEDNLKKNQALVMEVMARKNDATYMPILERVDTSYVREVLAEELAMSGIEDKFSFALVCYRGKRDVNFVGREFSIDGEDVYKQLIFRRDVTNRPYYIVLNLEEKTAYVMRYMKLVFPILVCMTLLAVLVILTLFYLIQNQKLSEIQSAFIKNMTHELKTPVASISLAAEMMSDPSLKLPIESYVSKSKTIKSEASRLTQIVERVLQTSVLGQEGVTYKADEVDVHRIIEEARESFMLKVQQSKGKILLHLEAQKHIIYADKMHITNVVFNLMENAVKYSDKERPIIIEITTSNKGNKLLIEVTDNGIGIEGKYLSRIFDRFYRVPSQGEHHDVKGFGLGLSYVKEVVIKNGGNIEVQSEPGVGTKFTIGFDAF